MKLRLELDSAAWADLDRRLGAVARKSIRRANRAVLRLWGHAIIDRLRRGPAPRSDTGSLAESWDPDRAGRIVDVGGRGERGFVAQELRSQHPAAGIHETGGVIRPRRGRYLRIPLTDRARRLQSQRMPDAFVIRSRAGNLLVVEREGRGIRPLYALKTQVRMPERRYLSQALREAEAEMPEVIEATTREVLREEGFRGR